MRQLLLSTHYRQKLNFTFDGLHAAESGCSRLQRMVDRLRERTGLSADDLERLDREAADNAKPGEARTPPADAPEHTAMQARREFLEALDDDLNIARAQAAVFELARFLNASFADQERGGAPPEEALLRDALLFFYQANQVLDTVDFTGSEADYEESAAADAIDSQERERIGALVQARQTARKSKDFAEADRIRDELAALGVVVKDTPAGPVWEKSEG